MQAVKTASVVRGTHRHWTAKKPGGEHKEFNLAVNPELKPLARDLLTASVCAIRIGRIVWHKGNRDVGEQPRRESGTCV